MTTPRALSIAFRTLHLGAFGLVLGGVAFGIEATRLVPALQLTVASGVGLVAVEVYGAGAEWFVTGKGLAVLLKLVLLLAVPLLREQQVVLLLLVVIVASVGAHMPGRYRHASLLAGVRQGTGAER